MNCDTCYHRMTIPPVAYCAPELGTEDLGEWASRVVPLLTRRVRHQGNHKYAWTLNRRDRRHLPESMPYPKFPEAT
jgi:hypothetical protein